MCVKEETGVAPLGYYHLVDDLFLTDNFREDLVVDVIGSDGKGVANFHAFVVFANGLPDELALHGDALVVLTLGQPWKNQDDAPDLRAINKEVVEWVNGFGWILEGIQLMVMQRSFLVFYLSSCDGCKLLTSSWTELLVGVSYRTYLEVPSILVPTFFGVLSAGIHLELQWWLRPREMRLFHLFAWAADSSPGHACESVSPLVNFPRRCTAKFHCWCHHLPNPSLLDGELRYGLISWPTGLLKF